MKRPTVLAIALLVVAACGASPSSPELSSSPSVEPSAVVDPAPSPSASIEVPAIVGEWVGTQDCARIVEILTEAGLDEFVVGAVYGNELVPGVDPSTSAFKDPAKPCDGAVSRAHSHFFTAAGQFGSKDFRGKQVDDGPYRVEGADVLVIGDQRFTYHINGDELTLEPPAFDAATCTTADCRGVAGWTFMVAMPGMTWKRGEIPAS